jgi:hypothetical protein
MKGAATRPEAAAEPNSLAQFARLPVVVAAASAAGARPDPLLDILFGVTLEAGYGFLGRRPASLQGSALCSGAARNDMIPGMHAISIPG